MPFALTAERYWPPHGASAIRRGVRRLMMKLKGVAIDVFCTDNWESFAEVLPKDKHLTGKQFTKKIEGVNTWFRTRLRRLARRTTCFSKKLLYH